jgi:hypothetical protein
MFFLQGQTWSIASVIFVKITAVFCWGFSSQVGVSSSGICPLMLGPTSDDWFFLMAGFEWISL